MQNSEDLRRSNERWRPFQVIAPVDENDGRDTFRAMKDGFALTRAAMYWLAAPLVVCSLFCGCSRKTGTTVAKGVIFSVSYKDGDGKTHGFTRLNMATAVSGGNGSWNVDAYGELTPDFLIITRPQRRDLGPLVIPVRNLVNIQFGDGGIKKVNEGQSAVAVAR